MAGGVYSIQATHKKSFDDQAEASAVALKALQHTQLNLLFIIFAIFYLFLFNFFFPISSLNVLFHFILMSILIIIFLIAICFVFFYHFLIEIFSNLIPQNFID
jgi:hypothetical protein